MLTFLGQNIFFQKQCWQSQKLMIQLELRHVKRWFKFLNDLVDFQVNFSFSTLYIFIIQMHIINKVSNSLRKSSLFWKLFILIETFWLGKFYSTSCFRYLSFISEFNSVLKYLLSLSFCFLDLRSSTFIFFFWYFLFFMMNDEQYPIYGNDDIFLCN